MSYAQVMDYVSKALHVVAALAVGAVVIKLTGVDWLSIRGSPTDWAILAFAARFTARGL